SLTSCPRSRARAAPGAPSVRRAPGQGATTRMQSRSRPRPDAAAPSRLPMPSVRLRMPAQPRHGQSSEPACGRAGLGRAATSCLVVSAHRRLCRLVPSVDLRPRHVSPLCVTGTTLRIAVGGSCVIEASRHLRFRPVGVARYPLAGRGAPTDPSTAPRAGRSGLADKELRRWAHLFVLGIPVKVKILGFPK
ncbi:MAG: hypothetical protein QOG99_2789, partial [Frankiales bacterium]|nr:hypothetical protein [Frankiales bacterium]